MIFERFNQPIGIWIRFSGASQPKKKRTIKATNCAVKWFLFSLSLSFVRTMRVFALHKMRISQTDFIVLPSPLFQTPQIHSWRSDLHSMYVLCGHKNCFTSISATRSYVFVANYTANALCNFAWKYFSYKFVNTHFS